MEEFYCCKVIKSDSDVHHRHIAKETANGKTSPSLFRKL